MTDKEEAKRELLIAKLEYEISKYLSEKEKEKDEPEILKKLGYQRRLRRLRTIVREVLDNV